MIDRMTRDGALYMMGGFALATQWGFIAVRFIGPEVVMPWLILGCGAGFVFCWFYGSDLAVAIRRRRRQRAKVGYPPMEM